MAAGWRRIKAALLAVCLGLTRLVTACSGSSGPLTGNYAEDTVVGADQLMATIAIAADDPGRSEAETSARALFNDYMARYRPQAKFNGLASFTTMQTALNSLAGHYASYANRPLPEALHDRIAKELNKAEKSVVQGS